MKIEKNIPIAKRRATYSWREMKVGDSVFFDNAPGGSQAKQSKAAVVWGQTNNAKFSARKEGNGVRIWRVA
jgi:hypothetical protein